MNQPVRDRLHALRDVDDDLARKAAVQAQIVLASADGIRSLRERAREERGEDLSSQREGRLEAASMVGVEEEGDVTLDGRRDVETPPSPTAWMREVESPRDRLPARSVNSL
jgi:hypothetical protein